MPGILVQKFGGTSVGDAECIRRVAGRIADAVKAGNSVVVVVSAMGKATDHLIELSRQIAANPPKRELDVLLSTGEMVSIAMVAMALEEIGIPAISFTGAQVKVLTDGNFGNARIEHIGTGRLLEELKSGKVCVVAGFQGVDANESITTLGRGGSDTSAVALAAALGAHECEIYTDVDGVYTTDPNKVPAARKLGRISYDEMLELASLGAGVLHSRSVEFAKKYKVVVHVRSSFKPDTGTFVVPEEQIVEKLTVTGVTATTNQARLSLRDIPDRPGIAAEIFDALAQNKINVDMIVQSTGHDDLNTIAFTIPESDIATADNVLSGLITAWGSGTLSKDPEIAIISAVGVGMRSHTGVAARLFRALASAGINIKMISTSEIKISCVIDRSRTLDALTIAHGVFGLESV